MSRDPIDQGAERRGAAHDGSRPDATDGESPASGRSTAAWSPLAGTGEPPGSSPGVTDAGFPRDSSGRYRIESLRGAGGMGRVYKAWDQALSRPVALKFLNSDDGALLERFSREALALARIDHPNICKIYEVTRIDDRPAIVMQYVDGPTLLEAGAELTVEQRVAVVAKVAEALHATHRIGLVHRDLKPANILLEIGDDGQPHPFVVDFGLVWGVGDASLTATGVTVGTPAYMAPEQAAGSARAVDRRVDVYGLGATLYAALTGSPPFVGDTPIDVMVRVFSEDPVPLRTKVPALPEDLETITLKCLHKEPGRRYESARALAEDLRRYLDGEPILARPPTLGYRLAKRVRKNRAVVSVAGVAMLAMIVVGWLWFSDRRSAARQADLARRFTQKVEQVEGVLWRARSLPAHDILPTQALVRTRLREIEEEVAKIGRLAELPGHSAIGRCYLALFDYDKAREHLELAWNGGDTSPVVAYSLGLTLGQLYQRGLAEVERDTSEATRVERREQLLRALRDPAIAYLRRSSGFDVATPEYVEALLAFYEGRNEDALRLSRIAYQRVPWLFEARLVEGQVHSANGRASRNAGRLEEAVAAYAEAEAALREAARIAESDVRTHDALCSLGYERLYIEVWVRGEWDGELLDRAITDCETANKVNHEWPRAFLTLAMVLETWVEHLGARGQDSTTIIEPAMAAAAEAVRLDPGNVRALGQLGSLYWQRGKVELEKGLDPRASFRQSVAFIDEALAIHPRDDHVLNNLGLTLLDLGVWEADNGLDPTASLTRASEAFAASGDASGADWIAYTNVGTARQVLLDYQVDTRTGNIEATAHLGLEALRHAITLNPSTFWPHRALGTIHLAMARHARARREDPLGALGEAIAALERSLTLNPNDATGYARLAQAHVMAAEHAVERGDSAAASLTAARLAVGRGLALNPGAGPLLEAQQAVRSIEARRPAAPRPN